MLDLPSEPLPYEAETWGPAAVDDLIAPRTWAGVGVTPVERSATIPDTEMLDRLPDDPAWGHGRVAGSGEVMLPLLGGYDIGATVAQTLARRHADRVRALALFNPAYPGIGGRRFDPSVQREFWYQHFHALTWSDRLIAHDRETVRLYLEYFYDHWCGRKEAIREREFEALVDVYARPGAVRASIAYYRARAAQRPKPAPHPRTPGSVSPR